MTATSTMSMPDDVYLRRLRVLGAWWRLGSSALNPELLFAHREDDALAGTPWDAPAADAADLHPAPTPTAQAPPGSRARDPMG